MTQDDLELTTFDQLKGELQRMEGVPKGRILGVVKWTDAAGKVFNRIFHEAAPAGGMAQSIQVEELKGTTEEAQRKEIATVLKAGSEPVDWTVIRVKEAAGERDVNVLLHRKDGGTWVKGLAQATAGLRESIVAAAVAEWEWFGKQEVDVTGQKSAPGKQEDSDDGSERVALYWREGAGELGITGKDRNQYWSAAFISYVMFKAGAGALFRRSDHHQEYIYAAMMAAKEKRNDYGYWGARLEDHPPELGDLICAWREEKITFEDAQKPGSYASHCDLVVDKTETTVTVIGGNVSQSVTKRTFRLENGKVTPDTYPRTFAILENRMPAAAERTISAKLLDEVAPAQPSKALPKVEFTPLGKNAPIRGSFNITAQQIEKLCTGAKERYAFYATAIFESSKKYGINPLFVLADFLNQGVNKDYRNPWGISVDFYPFGPNGSQLGQPNGSVKNGPRKFGENEWRIAFDRQFAVVANPKGKYKNANTIAQWAMIDAPPGAENDVHNTNAQEGRDVGEGYDKLVQLLKA
jgi:hypothetical protein